METRSEWGSRFGFIMTTAGFAVGLGAIWRFPYMMSKNGGGAFLLVYVLMALCIGIPLFISEIMLGRHTKLGAIAGMKKISGKWSIFRLIGWLGTGSAILILSYYTVILSMILGYFVKFVCGDFVGLTTPDEVSKVFVIFSSSVTGLYGHIFATILIMGGIINAGLKSGIERSCKYLMPVLFLFLLVLAWKSLMLPGAMEGVKWFLNPNFAAIDSGVVLDALCHTFFAIGIGVSTAFVYGSYLDKERSDIPVDAMLIIAINTGIAILAGLVIFPAMASFGLENAQSSGLVFETMPLIFSSMEGGWFWGSMFFFLIIVSGFASGVGLIEGASTTLRDQFSLSRTKALVLVLAAVLVLSVPTAISYGAASPFAHMKFLGKTVFELVEFLTTGIFIPVGALLISLYIVFVFGFERFMEEVNCGARLVRVTSAWKPFVTLLAPGAVVVVLAVGLLL